MNTTRIEMVLEAIKGTKARASDAAARGELKEYKDFSVIRPPVVYENYGCMYGGGNAYYGGYNGNYWNDYYGEQREQNMDYIEVEVKCCPIFVKIVLVEGLKWKWIGTDCTFISGY